MRWPNWTDSFGRCFGLRQGPHHQHYDAWLARERLNQVKRLEIALADLTRENGQLTARLGQAVGILDSYHSFDLDQMGIAAVAGAGSLSPAAVQALRQGSGSRRQMLGSSASGSDRDPTSSLHSAPATARSGSLAHKPPNLGRVSTASQPPKVPHRGALGRSSAGPGSYLHSQAPAAVVARGGSLAFHPSVKVSQPPPARVRQMIRERSPDAPARVASMSMGIPTKEELDSLLRRSDPAQRPPAVSPARPALETIPPPKNSASAPPPAPPQDLASVMSRKMETIGDSPAESHVSYEGSADLSDHDTRMVSVPSLGAKKASSKASSTTHARASFDNSGGLGPRISAFSFAPPSAAASASPHQMDLPMSSPFSVGNVAPPSLPAVMMEANTQPVRTLAATPVLDTPRLATQARGQIYTSHYTPESSPFAKAAARMPATDGKMPLSRHLPAAR